VEVSLITKSVFNTKILLMIFSLSALKAHALPLKNLEQQLVRSHLDLKSMDAEMTSLNLQKESQESLFAPKINFKAGWANEKKPEVNNDGPVAYGQISWNLFNGGKDYKTITRTEKQKNILGLNTEIEKNKVILQLRKLLIEQSFLQQEKHLLHASHQEHELHIQALKKKIHSGLSLDLELVRFELDVTKMELAENELIQKIRVAT
jgi:outer membrane protein TolC